jgi:ribosome-binding protein aMBF1 (putative translation factor)
MNEKSLNELLACAVRQGDLGLELNDAIVDSLLEQPWQEVSADAKARVKAQLRIRMQDSAIALAKQALEIKSPALGRFLEAVRQKANLTRVDIAERLKKADEYVQRLERGDLSPVQLPTRELADVVELFCLRVSEVSEMIVATLQTANIKQTYRAAARSHGGVRHDLRGEDVERALDAFARKMRQKLAARSGLSDDVRLCISKLEEELKRRGRVELLK